MKTFKKLSKGLLILVGIVGIYFLAALILSYIPVSEGKDNSPKDHTIYLHTNGVHLDLIIPRDLLSAELLEGLNPTPRDTYFSFGWGDRDFYLNTPNWDDLTFSTAFSAMFLPSSTLMHVSRYRGKPLDAVQIKLSKGQMKVLNQGLIQSFALDEQGNKIILSGKGYANYDDFFKAHGSYSCCNTCNTWINDLLKSSGVKACAWTPFDFGLMDLHSL